jgi:hypothetical protein
MATVVQPHGPAPEVAVFKGQQALTSTTPIAFVYYTEADQLLRIRDALVLKVMSANTNVSCLFVPQRREKGWKTDPTAYMEGLSSGQRCGESDRYAIDWAVKSYVQYTLQSKKVEVPLVSSGD